MAVKDDIADFIEVSFSGIQTEEKFRLLLNRLNSEMINSRTKSLVMRLSRMGYYDFQIILDTLKDQRVKMGSNLERLALIVDRPVINYFSRYMRRIPGRNCRLFDHSRLDTARRWATGRDMS